MNVKHWQEGNCSTLERASAMKPVPLSFCAPQIQYSAPCGLTWDYAMRSLPLTPTVVVMVNQLGTARNISMLHFHDRNTFRVTNLKREE